MDFLSIFLLQIQFFSKNYRGNWKLNFSFGDGNMFHSRLWQRTMEPTDRPSCEKLF